MKFRRSDGGSRSSAQWRRWAIRISIACLALEVVYLIVGNLCLRMGVLEQIINYRPEADFVSWDSGVTYLPGFGSFKEFVYRGQTRDGQMYVHLAEVDARISLSRLLFKTLHIKGVNAKDLDYRSRERITSRTIRGIKVAMMKEMTIIGFT